MKTGEQASDTLISFYFLLFFLPSARFAGMDSIPGLKSKAAYI